MATVTATVTEDAPGYAGLYLWKYHVVNNAFASSGESFDPVPLGGIATFAVPAEDAGMVSNLGNSVGWTGSVGTLMSDPNLVSWQANGQPQIGITGSADFWFTTAPTGLDLTNGFVADAGLTTLTAGLLAFPINAAPVPQRIPALVVRTAVDAATDTSLTLREVIDKINLGLTDRGQVVTEIRFALAPTDKTITLNSQLPKIDKTMFINGENNNVTVTRDATKGNFRLFLVGDSGLPQLPTVTISNLTLKGGGGLVGANPVLEGGAIRSYANLVLIGCTIRDNAASDGAGVCAQGGTLNLTNCNVYNNEGSAGGGVFIGEGISRATITGGSIHNNTVGNSGGGVFIISDVGNIPIDLLGVQIYDNSAEIRGGGVCVYNNQIEGASPQLTLGNDTVIMNNYATGAFSEGGGVYFGAGTLVLGNANITGNGAASGGGLYLVTGTTWNGDPYGFIWNNLPNNVEQGP